MISMLSRSVRFAFVTLLLGLTVYTVFETALGGGRTAVAQAADEGLSTCGTPAQPCTLEAVAVVAQPAPVQLAAEGLTACGSQEQPCVLAPVAVQAERESARLASTERAVGMTLRVGS